MGNSGILASLDTEAVSFAARLLYTVPKLSLTVTTPLTVPFTYTVKVVTSVLAFMLYVNVPHEAVDGFCSLQKPVSWATPWGSVPNILIWIFGSLVVAVRNRVCGNVLQPVHVSE